MASSGDETPLMKQYLELKAQAPDALLLFRMGDFYELFADDAVEAARILEITLTSRDRNKPNPMPMAGVPWHSAQGYIQRLLKAGKKVAIGEQVEDPATVKAGKIVRRAIVRTFMSKARAHVSSQLLRLMAKTLFWPVSTSPPAKRS
jgi:DNA mismatch repair protein MutS